MDHLPTLIHDLGLILSIAAVTTLTFKMIKQPVVLGYIIAGVLVGPYVTFLPTVKDEQNITVWSEIGVIFLLFSLGLEFSFKKLAKVGGTASITAIVEAVGMLAAGYFTGMALGWSVMDSIFLGGILSISSTTIIIRAFNELGVKTQQYALLVFGVLIVEDLVAILLLVLLSTLSVSQNFSGNELIWAIGKLGFFLVLWFLGGIFLIPSLIRALKKQMNDETLLILSVALCLSMVVLAVNSGFSAALGAFIMGSLLAETIQGERIEHLVRPITDLFASIFFVSVGMLIEPSIIVTQWFPILVITLVTIVGKILITGTGAILAGEPLKRAVQASMSLTQIGEFSFIIATLGLTMKVSGPFLYPVSVAVSAITTFTTPYLIKISPRFADLLARSLPASSVKALDRYSGQAQEVKVVSDWRRLLRSYIMNIVVFSVLSVGVILLGVKHIQTFFLESFDTRNAHMITGILSLVLIAPLIWAMSVRRIEKEAYRSLWVRKRHLRGPLVMLEVLRLTIGILLVAIIVYTFFSTIWALVGCLALMLIAGVVFRQRLHGFYQRVEKHFLLNLNQRWDQKRSDLAPWDMHLAEVTIGHGSPIAGKSLLELQLRERFSVNIALIDRFGHLIPAPGRDERLLPGDGLLVIGTDESLTELNDQLIGSYAPAGEQVMTKEDIGLLKYRVLPRSPLVGKAMNSCGLRELANAMVAGIERDGLRLMNPSGEMPFRELDIIWLVGNARAIKAYMVDKMTTRE